MLKKYKDKLKIKKISLKDNSFIYCKPENISLAKLSFLQHGNTFYGKFIPKSKSNRINYRESQEKIKNLVVKDINLGNFMKKYKKFYKKRFNRKLEITKRVQKIIDSYNDSENRNLELMIWFRDMSKKYLRKECVFFREFIDSIIKQFELDIYNNETFILKL